MAPCNHNSIVFLCFLFALFLLLPTVAFAGITPDQPDKAVFYPDEVQLNAEVEADALILPSGGKGFVVVLPYGALRDTFMLSIGGVPAQGYSWP